MTIKQALENWTKLNDFLRTCTEKDAGKLLDAEKLGASREVVLLRIHATYNKLRGRREKTELREIGMRGR